MGNEPDLKRRTIPSSAPWLFTYWLAMLLLTHSPFHFKMEFFNTYFLALMCSLPPLMFWRVFQGRSKLVYKILKSVGLAFILFAIFLVSGLLYTDRMLFCHTNELPPTVVDSKNSIVVREFTTNFFSANTPSYIQLEQVKEIFPGLERKYLLKELRCSGVTITSKDNGVVDFHTNEEPDVKQEIPLVR